jgi:hypothetical protein
MAFVDAGGVGWGERDHGFSLAFSVFDAAFFSAFRASIFRRLRMAAFANLFDGAAGSLGLAA